MTRPRLPLFRVKVSKMMGFFLAATFFIGVTEGSVYDADEWSKWSEWSPCSRTCDGGVTSAFRRCKSVNGCHGESIRRRMCNMQPCSDFQDYRSEQCKSFDGIQYKGEKRTWEAIEDPENPCILLCRAEGTDIIAKLSDKLRDGTRCQPGALHVCVDGRCETVGCDLKLGSPKNVDECGVCGGDGSTCKSPVYRWEVVPHGTCTAKCGGGQQPVKVLCRDGITAENKDPFLCNSAQKPYRSYQSCNIHPCDPEWQIGEWSECAVTCGGGLRIRRVYCAQEKNSTKIQVVDKLCKIKKPANQEPCNMDPCPHWHVGTWSPCSTPCGGGTETRNVVCRDFNNLPSSGCDPSTQPEDSRDCEDPQPCSTTTAATSPSPPSSTLENFDFTTDNFESELYIETPEELPREHTLPLIQPYPHMDDTLLFDHQAVPPEPTFVAEPWGPCSQTCGEGTRERKVNCKIFLEFSRTIATLPDKECTGPKPVETESCILRPCSEEKANSLGEEMENLSDSHQAALADSDSTSLTSNFRKTISVGIPPGISMQDMTFSWKVLGYSPCSASCLGGIQEAMIQCVRDFDQRVATPVLCMDKPQPDIATTRTCNDHPCPPRWNVSDFGTCSKPCGGGVMTREVNCIHEVTRGNTVTVPNSICPQPTPRTERLCNTVNCPPYWEPGDWSRCTKTCGGGSRTRILHCKQIIALGQVVEYPNSDGHCNEPKPVETRPCNRKPCTIHKGTKEVSGPNESAVEVSYHQTEWNKKLSITVKGIATVYNGVSVKLRCPAKSMDKTRISWMKDYHYMNMMNNKVQIIPKSGVLKIKNTTFSDSGVYICLLNERMLSNLTLNVTPYQNYNVDTPKPTVRHRPVGETKKIRQRGPSHESTLFADQQMMWPVRNLLRLKEPQLDSSFRDLLGDEEESSGSCGPVCAKTVKWKLGDWDPCSSQHCFTWNTSLQRREVVCEFLNGTKTSDSNCEVSKEKPEDSNECYLTECQGVWKTEPWSQCKSRCGSVGFKTRILKCVWFGSYEPAGNACQSLTRPIVKKPCRGPACLKLEDCKDRSRKCAAIRTFNLCHLRLYQFHCCESCFEEKYPTHKLRHYNPF